jgi:hypothetical protein
MRRLVIVLCLLLIFGHVLTEVASVLTRIWPEAMNQKVNLFWRGGFDMELYWYIKMSADDLLFTISFFVMSKIAYQYSFRLFLVCVVFFVYHLIDSLMFWYDFKTSHWFYWTMIVSVICTVMFLILPVEKIRSKYKSLT